MQVDLFLRDPHPNPSDLVLLVRGLAGAGQTFNRNVSAMVDISLEVLGRVAFNRVGSEAVPVLDDEASRLFSGTRAIFDSGPRPVGSVSRTLSLTREVTESVVVDAMAASAYVARRNAVEVVDLADADATYRVAFSRNVVQQAIVAAQAARTITVSRRSTVTVPSLTDSARRMIAASRRAEDVVAAVAAEASRASTFPRLLVEGVTATADASRVLAVIRRVEESGLVPLGTPSRTLDLLRFAVEQVAEVGDEAVYFLPHLVIPVVVVVSSSGLGVSLEVAEGI